MAVEIHNLLLWADEAQQQVPPWLQVAGGIVTVVITPVITLLVVNWQKLRQQRQQEKQEDQDREKAARAPYDEEWRGIIAELKSQARERAKEHNKDIQRVERDIRAQEERIAAQDAKIREQDVKIREQDQVIGKLQDQERVCQERLRKLEASVASAGGGGG